MAELDLREVTADELPTTLVGREPRGGAPRRRRGPGPRDGGVRRGRAGRLRAAAVAGTGGRVRRRRRRSQVGPRRQGVRAGGAIRRRRAWAGWRSTRCSRATSSTRPPPLPPGRLVRAVPRRRRAGLGGGRGRRAAVRRGRRGASAGGRSRRRGPAGAGDGGADRPTGPARRCSKTWSSRWPRCWPAWRRAACGSTSTTSRRWARASANGWRRSRPRSTSEAGRGVQPELAAAAARGPLRASSACSPGRRPRRASCRPTPACWRSSATSTRSSTRCSQWRELDKLNSTYLEALPKLVDPRDGRIHTTFNQAAAATGPAQQLQPQPAEHPGALASSGARSVGRSCPASPARCCWSPTTPRSSCGSWRTSRATRGCARRSPAGDGHPRRDRREACSTCRSTRSTASSRRRAKVVNYGLAYGMNAWGLAQRLDIAPDEAQEIMDGYFAGFPKIKDVPGPRRSSAPRWTGFTETILGRRRYIPELPGGNRAAARPGGAPGAERPDPGQRQRRLQDGDDRAWTEPLREHAGARLPHAADRARRAGVRGAGGDRSRRPPSWCASGWSTRSTSRCRSWPTIGWGPNWSDAAPAGH